MYASREDQQRLLQLQEVDRRIAQLGAVSRKHPAVSALRELEQRRDDLDRIHITIRSQAKDAERDLKRIEDDLERLVARQDTMGARLSSGQGSHKDLQAIQYELNQMAQRRDVLETELLEAMNTCDEVKQRVAEVRGQIEAIGEDETRLRGELSDALKEVDSELAQKQSERAELTGAIDSALLDEYEYCRSRTGGLGVMEAQGRQIVGMVTDLSESEWHAITSLGDEEVYLSEELECLVVKTR